MDAKLIEKTAAEKMFARQCRTTEMLLANSNTSTRIIERHLAELTTRWSVLQEKHDLYVAEFVHDTAESSANDATCLSFFELRQLAIHSWHQLRLLLLRICLLRHQIRSS